jgi:hypothetical protein
MTNQRDMIKPGVCPPPIKMDLAPGGVFNSVGTGKVIAEPKKKAISLYSLLDETPAPTSAKRGVIRRVPPKSLEEIAAKTKMLEERRERAEKRSAERSAKYFEEYRRRLEIEEMRSEALAQNENKESQIEILNKNEITQFFEERKENHLPPNFTSMKGGCFLIPSKDFEKLSVMIAYAHSISYDLFLSERPSTFKFFLDIEDKELKFCFDDTIANTIIDTAATIFNEVMEAPNTTAIVARNSKYWEHKVHIVFPHIIMNHQGRYKSLVNRIKQSLNSKIAQFVDSNASSLRPLAVCKAPKKVSRVVGRGMGFKDGVFCEMDQVEMVDEKKPRQYGIYLPESDSNDSKWSVIDADTKKVVPFKDGVTPEVVAQFLLKSNEAPTPFKQDSIFWKCIQYLENNRDDSLEKYCDSLTDEEKVGMLPGLVEMIPASRAEYRNGWLTVGKCIYQIVGKDGLDLFIAFSKKSKKHQQNNEYETSSREMFDELENDAEPTQSERNEAMMSIINMCCGVNFQQTAKLIGFSRDMEAFKQKQLQDVQNYQTINLETIKRDDRYVDPAIFPESKRMCIVKAPLGSGKTTSIIRFLQSKRAESKLFSFCWVCTRKSHANQIYQLCQSNDVSCVLYSNERGSILQSCVVEYESLFRLQRTYDVVIMDEVESLYQQLSSETTNGKNIDDNAEMFQSLLCSPKVILADAFLKQRSIDMVKFIAKNDEISVYEFTTQNLARNYYKYFDEKFFNDKLYQAIANGKKVYLFTSSLAQSEHYYKHCVENNIKCLKYSSKDEALSAEDNVNDLWRDVQVIITTSTITIGVNPDQVVFDSVFCHMSNESGVLVRDMAQSLYRVRKMADCEGDANVHIFQNDKYPNYERRYPINIVQLYHILERQCINRKEAFEEEKTFIDRFHTISFESFFARCYLHHRLEKQINHQFFNECMDFYLDQNGYHQVFVFPKELDENGKCVSNQGAQEILASRNLPFDQIVDLTPTQIELFEAKKLKDRNKAIDLQIQKYLFTKSFDVAKMTQEECVALFERYKDNARFQRKISTFRKVINPSYDYSFKANESKYMLIHNDFIKIRNIFNTFQKNQHLPFHEMYALVKEDHSKIACYDKKKSDYDNMNAFLSNYTPYKYRVDKSVSKRVNGKVQKVSTYKIDTEFDVNWVKI